MLNLKSPFIFLTSKEKDALLSKATYVEYIGNQQEVFLKENDGKDYCLLILEGEFIAVDTRSQASEILGVGDSFGFDACLFGMTYYKVVTASSECIVMKIHSDIMISILEPDKQFTVMVGSNLLNKQRIFSPIEKFRSYIAESVESGDINVKKLLKAYKAINSSLHPGRKSIDLDIGAWRYSVNRLPENLCSTFVYFISTTLPDICNHPKIITKVKTVARHRMIYCMLSGKNFIILRDLVSDINDLIANFCIHIIESKKLRYKLRSHSILDKLLETRDISQLPLNDEEKSGLRKMWGDSVVDMIMNMMVHHEDYKFNVCIPSCQLKMSPLETWTEGLWKGCMEALEMQVSVAEAIGLGLVVDFMQGAIRSILNALSPYLRLNAKKITDWFEGSGIKLQTKDLYRQSDRVIAMSFYYFQKFPEEARARAEMDRASGIITIEETHNTGVKATVINVAKLSTVSTQFIPKSKMHLIICIGFTFGKQSYEMVKNINLLLGKSLESYTIVGKAGGLMGERNDILVATNFLDEVSKNIVGANPAGISQSLLQKETDSIVHMGQMLTVSGTILQNTKMLLYYKIIEGCIGLEMEGAYIALCIKHCIKSKIIRKDVITRFIYYVSDMPLNTEATLASEIENVNWKEGLKSINGIIRYTLGLMNKKLESDTNTELETKVSALCKKHARVVVIGTSTDSMNSINHNFAPKLAEEMLDEGFAVIYLGPEEGIKPFMRRISQKYVGGPGFFPEAIADDLAKLSGYKENNLLVISEYKSSTDYINKLHCISQTTASAQNKVSFVISDIPYRSEILSRHSGRQIVDVKTSYENLKIECPQSNLMFFRTDLETVYARQKEVLDYNKFDFVFTRCEESNMIDILTSEKAQSILAYPTTELSRFILEVIRS